MSGMIKRLFTYCNTYYRDTDSAVEIVDYAVGRYGLNTDRQYWRDLVRDGNDQKLLKMRIPFSEFFDMMEKADVDRKKVMRRGMAKLLRSYAFSDPDVGFIEDNLLLKLFLDEINERDRIKTSYNSMKCSDYLWYVSFEGRLGRVKWGGAKCNAEKMLKKGWIAKDQYGIYRANRVLNGCGCEYVKHRPIIKSLSRDKWTREIVDKLTDLLDGGHEVEYVIDRDFAAAYEPDYDTSEHIDDLVTSQSCMSCRPDEAESFYGNIDGCYVMRFLKDDEDIGRCIMYEWEGIRHFIRIYCQPEYQRDCLYTLRRQMRENDLLGRCEQIEGIHLLCHFDGDTDNMYLDGNRYGFKVEDGKIYLVAGSCDYDGESTSSGRFADSAEEGYIHQCYDCGKWISTRDGSAIRDEDEDRWYCCSSCAANNDYVECAYCGEYHHCEICTDDGNYYCCANCAEEDGYVRPDDVYQWIPREDAFWVNEYTCFSDEDAARDAGWVQCSVCGEWMQEHYPCTDGKPRCSTCLSNEGWHLKYVKDEPDVKEETTTVD